jgi:hypothetical protein
MLAVVGVTCLVVGLMGMAGEPLILRRLGKRPSDPADASRTRQFLRAMWSTEEPVYGTRAGRRTFRQMAVVGMVLSLVGLVLR